MKRLQWHNTTQVYGIIAFAFHWLSALSFIGLFVLGWWMVDLGYYDAWYQTGPLVHQSIGILMILITLARLTYKFTTLRPKALGSDGQKRMAHAGHSLLYTLVFLLLVTGYLISAADGEAIWIFNWFTIPSLVVLPSAQLDWVGLVHEWGSYGFIAVIVIHVGAAALHHWVHKDTTLTRMAWPFSSHNSSRNSSQKKDIK